MIKYSSIPTGSKLMKPPSKSAHCTAEYNRIYIYIIYHTISDKNEVQLADERSAESYDIIDEIVVRVLQMGGEVLTIRQDENAPQEVMPIAAILRWA